MSQITYEPFQAAFTGTLSVYMDTLSTRWKLTPPLRMERGDYYMMKIDRGKGTCKFLPVIPPPIRPTPR